MNLYSYLGNTIIEKDEGNYCHITVDGANKHVEENLNRLGFGNKREKFDNAFDSKKYLKEMANLWNMSSPAIDFTTAGDILLRSNLRLYFSGNEVPTRQPSKNGIGKYGQFY